MRQDAEQIAMPGCQSKPPKRFALPGYQFRTYRELLDSTAVPYGMGNEGLVDPFPGYIFGRAIS